MKFAGNSWKLFGLKVAIFRNNFQQLAVLMIASYFFHKPYANIPGRIYGEKRPISGLS